MLLRHIGHWAFLNNPSKIQRSQKQCPHTVAVERTNTSMHMGHVISSNPDLIWDLVVWTVDENIIKLFFLLPNFSKMFNPFQCNLRFSNIVFFSSFLLMSWTLFTSEMYYSSNSWKRSSIFGTDESNWELNIWEFIIFF